MIGKIKTDAMDALEATLIRNLEGQGNFDGHAARVQMVQMHRLHGLGSALELSISDTVWTDEQSVMMVANIYAQQGATLEQAVSRLFAQAAIQDLVAMAESIALQEETVGAKFTTVAKFDDIDLGALAPTAASRADTEEIEVGDE